MLIKFKPTSPGLRGTVLVSKKELSNEKPHKLLTKKFKSTGGRNNQGRITSRRMGGGVKRKYRLIDFKRSKFDISGEVIRNEYDPNRTAFISLVKYNDGELSVIDNTSPFFEYGHWINNTIPYLETLEGKTIKPHIRIINQNSKLNITENNCFSLYLFNRILV